MSEEKKHTNFWKRKWFYTILSALVIALVLRAFVFGSYRMPTSQMENAVWQGDYLFVNKTAYGIRLPMTWLTVPFVSDSIAALGIKTYSEFLSLPYKRLFSQTIKRNDVIVYNIPSLQGDLPVDKLPLSISRCVGLPGDSIEVRSDGYFVNNKQLPQSPDLILPYKYKQHYDKQVSDVMLGLNIPFRDINSDLEDRMRYLSRFEAYSIRERLPDSIVITLVEREHLNYKLFIPKKGVSVRLLPQNLHIYKEIILKEQKGRAVFKDNQLYLDGSPVKFYIFNYDYYWMLSDNADASADSRHFGFIPETHLVGKAYLIWLSKDPSKNIFNGYRQNRIFTKVN